MAVEGVTFKDATMSVKDAKVTVGHVGDPCRLCTLGGWPFWSTMSIIHTASWLVAYLDPYIHRVLLVEERKVLAALFFCLPLGVAGLCPCIPVCLETTGHRYAEFA